MSASVSTRQIVVFDDGGAGGRTATQVQIGQIVGGTSAAQPVIAV
jgi:hypothetical protein